MTKKEMQDLAQQLVDAKIEIIKLQEEQNITKLELYDSAKGGIQCKGGKVYFVEEKEVKRFNQKKLRGYLEKLGLSDDRIKEIFQESRTETTISPDIYIQLD